MPVDISITDQDITAYLSGEIDHHSAKTIRAQIDEAVSRAKPDKLVLDFRGVSFMDSSGIGLVMGRYSLMQELGGEMSVVNLSTHIRKVMKLAGLDRLAILESGVKKA